MTARIRKRSGVLLLLTAGLTVASGAAAEELADLRTSFVRIEPCTRPPSAPVTREFSIPGPGTLRRPTTMSPWFRSSEPVLFRSLEPVGGRDEGAWTGHVPGVEGLSNSVQVTIEWTPDASGLPAPPPAGLEGRWADGEEIVTLQAQGNVVTGNYPFRDGRLSGTRSGQRVSGFWMQSLSSQRCSTERQGTAYRGRYELTLDGDRLEGRFGYCEGPLEKPWSWKRVP
jgi:hypothetical protein